MTLLPGKLLGVCLGLLVAAASARAAAPAVQVRLLGDADAVSAGWPFHLGVELRMEPGWHTYWQYGGDAGLPTQVEWQLPSGFAAGPLQWPWPQKYVEQGDLITYGYADQVLLLVEIRPPARLRADNALSFAARVSWLACREVCIPGDTSLVLRLPVRPAGKPANADLFARYRAKVPGPLGPELALRHQARRTTQGLQVDLELAGPEGRPEPDSADFYPSAAEGFEFRPTQRLGAREGARAGTVGLRLLLRPYGPELPTALDGVLVYRLAGEAEQRAGAVHLDLSSVEQGSLPGPSAAVPGGLLAMVEARQAGQERPVGVYLLLAVLGGLLLNLMPCVLPVISLKILGLVSQAGQESARVRRLGWAFSAGIVAAFAGLGGVVVVLKAGGQQLGWGFQFQAPGFVVAMAALVFVLGLSLFGVFVVRLPGTQGTLGGLAEGEGLAGSFFNGVLATILATPCTAPFLGTALGFAFSQPPAVILGVFVVVGAGMALPYILLALQPGWMRFLPRPGAWMERFKQLMGFLLMGTVLWLLWVLGKQLGVEAVIWAAAFLLGLGLASWVLGQWVDLRSSARQRGLAWAAAAAIASGGYAFFMHPVLTAEPALAGPDRGAPQQGLAWQPFSMARVEELIAGGRTVFVDFTAEWCWTCKVNERTVLADAEVRARFAALDVALVRADWTSRNPEITRLLRAFGRSGVPLYVIFPGGRPEQPLVLPEVVTTRMVLDRLDEAASLRR